jgi:hypothetical protein
VIKKDSQQPESCTEERKPRAGVGWAVDPTRGESFPFVI